MTTNSPGSSDQMGRDHAAAFEPVVRPYTRGERGEDSNLERATSIARAHGVFALLVFGSLFMGCLVWIVPEIGRSRHPYFPHFMVGQSPSGIVIAEWELPKGVTDLGRLTFFRGGPEVALPFKIWERKQYVAAVNPSYPFSPATVEQAIAAFIAANPDCDWTNMRLGPPPTLANSPIPGSLATVPQRSKFYIGGLFGSLALWTSIVLAVRSAFKWINRPRVTVGNLCARCKYDLSGLPAVASDGGSAGGAGVGVGVCPECGCPRVVPSPP